MNLVVDGRRCVVVGAGRIAARKIEALLDGGGRRPRGGAGGAGRRGPGLGRRRPAHRLRAEFAPTDLDDAWLATTATGDPAVNRAVFEAGEARRVWVNSADDPANCSFTLMSVVRQGDLVVTVGTGGRSPALATWLRRHFGEELGPEYATLLDLLSEAREEMRAAGRSSRGRRLAVRPSIPACST